MNFILQIKNMKLIKNWLVLFNSDKIRNETSWSEKISFEEGINDTIKWISDNWEIISHMPHEYIHNI